jgi:hypothetical protein
MKRAKRVKGGAKAKKRFIEKRKELRKDKHATKPNHNQ